MVFFFFLFLFRFTYCSDMKKPILPSASSILLNGNNTGQVFNNPYKRAEIDQIASLEKHVKMVWDAVVLIIVMLFCLIYPFPFDCSCSSSSLSRDTFISIAHFFCVYYTSFHNVHVLRRHLSCSARKKGMRNVQLYSWRGNKSIYSCMNLSFENKKKKRNRYVPFWKMCAISIFIIDSIHLQFHLM